MMKEYFEFFNKLENKYKILLLAGIGLFLVLFSKIILMLSIVGILYVLFLIYKEKKDKEKDESK